MEFEMDDATALELLLTMVEPIWICVQDFIHDDTKEKNWGLHRHSTTKEYCPFYKCRNQIKVYS
jgi:hypothetical protein